MNLRGLGCEVGRLDEHVFGVAWSVFGKADDLVVHGHTRHARAGFWTLHAYAWERYVVALSGRRGVCGVRLRPAGCGALWLRGG